MIQQAETLAGSHPYRYSKRRTENLGLPSNAKGFYQYTPAEAKRWTKRFLDFSYEIRTLALKYSERSKAEV
jgi:hypothetical protein